MFHGSHSPAPPTPNTSPWEPLVYLQVSVDVPGADVLPTRPEALPASPGFLSGSSEINSVETQHRWWK